MMNRQQAAVCHFTPCWCAVLVAFLCVAGCEQKPSIDYSQMKLVEVTGTVKLDGKPLDGATVMFESPDKRMSVGKTNASGEYTLMFDSEKSGVTPGEKTVRITYGGVEGGDEDAGGEDENGKAKAPNVKIPAKFNSKSDLKRTIKEGAGSQVFDFDLRNG